MRFVSALAHWVWDLFLESLISWLPLVLLELVVIPLKKLMARWLSDAPEDEDEDGGLCGDEEYWGADGEETAPGGADDDVPDDECDDADDLLRRLAQLEQEIATLLDSEEESDG